MSVGTITRLVFNDAAHTWIRAECADRDAPFAAPVEWPGWAKIDGFSLTLVEPFGGEGAMAAPVLYQSAPAPKDEPAPDAFHVADFGDVGHVVRDAGSYHLYDERGEVRISMLAKNDDDARAAKVLGLWAAGLGGSIGPSAMPAETPAQAVLRVNDLISRTGGETSEPPEIIAPAEPVATGDVYELPPPPAPPAVTEAPVAAPAAGPVDGSGDPDGPVAAAGAAAGVSGMAGTLIDQRRAELADALSAEYQARLAPVRDKRGEANAQIVRISNQPERTEEDFDRLNELHDHARAMDALLFKIAEHLATMQTALFRKSADELAKFDPTYGWPEASA